MEKLHARPLFPVSALCIFISVGNGKILVKAPEMVYSHDVIKGETMPYSGNPPFVSLFLVLFPRIKRISPKLSIFRKGIGRAAGDRGGLSFFRELKEGGVIQDIGRIQGNIDGNIPDNLNSFTIRIVL